MKIKSTLPVVGILLLVACLHSIKADWVLTNGPWGGCVSSLAVSGNTLFAGVSNAGGGVFYSTDNGTSWNTDNAGIVDDVWSLAASGSDIFFGTCRDRIYRSTDSGKNWTSAGSTLPTELVWALAFKDNHIFAYSSSL